PGSAGTVSSSQRKRRWQIPSCGTVAADKHPRGLRSSTTSREPFARPPWLSATGPLQRLLPGWIPFPEERWKLPRIYRGLLFGQCERSPTVPKGDRGRHEV